MLSTRNTLIIGSACTIAGVGSCAWVKDVSAAMLAGGVVAILVATMFVMTCWIVRTIRAVNRPADHAYELGYEMGYSSGWKDGRRADRPRVVTGIREASSAG